MSAVDSLLIVRDGDALRFVGALLRTNVAAAWRRGLPSLDGVVRFDLDAIECVDSAGVALLTELAARSGHEVAIDGNPPGLDELRGAYRLSLALAFAG